MRRLQLLGTLTVVALVLAACSTESVRPELADGIATQAIFNATIDFEGLAEGSIVDAVSDGSGISGDPIVGSVSVLGLNPTLDNIPNAAMIFDATCEPVCTGGDADLFAPAQGNVLIITEDGDGSDPDDADLTGESFVFDFSGYGPGVVDIESIVFIDVEGSENESAEVSAFGPGGVLLGTVVVPSVANGETEVVALGFTGVEVLSISLNGSGAIDDLVISVETPDEEPGVGRFTGGGKVIDDDMPYTFGLTLHCDVLLSNNLEINWGVGNKWHIEKESLVDVICTDDPDIAQRPPRAPLDTLTAEAVGKLTLGDTYKNADGAAIRFTIVDAGEPGRNDSISVMIWAPGDDPDVDAPVVSFSGNLENGGNLQAHYDQPHGNKP